jgi:3-phenylpropionate/cinnamic acid dioxygenase small subunit
MSGTLQEKEPGVVVNDTTRELLDRQAISDLLSDYCCTLDELNLEGFAALFTPDCDVRYGPVAVDSVDALLEFMAGTLPRFASHHHHVSNVVIVFEMAKRATFESYIYAWHQYPPKKQRDDMILHGRYRGVVVHTPDGWRIAALHGRIAEDDRPSA